jgi:hypothetical protein
MSNKAGFSFSRLTALLPSAKIVPGGIFSRCIQRLSGVCSETAFDMQRLLQVHALRQVGASETGVGQALWESSSSVR